MRVLFKNLTNYEFYCLFLELVNNAIKHDDRKIAPMELKMLSYFMDLPEKYDHKRFSASAKKKVETRAKEEDGWELNRLNINNKIYALITKGFLRRDEDNVIYLNHRLDKLVKDLRKVQESKKPLMSLTFDFEWDKEIDEEKGLTRGVVR